MFACCFRFLSGLVFTAVTAFPASAEFVFDQVALTGEPAPGVEDGAKFQSFDLQFLTLNAAGDIAFQAVLHAGDIADATTADSSNYEAIFGPTAGAGSALGLVAREGGVAPGVTDGSVFRSFISPPTLNAAGDVAFLAALQTGGSAGASIVNSSNNQAIFGPIGGAGSSLGPVARAGDVAPGVADGAKFNGFIVSGFLTIPVLNASGDVAFRAGLRTGDGAGAGLVNESNDEAIFGPVMGAGSFLGPVAREGDTAPGVTDGAKFGSNSVPIIFSTPSLNDAGDVLFSAELITEDGVGVEFPRTFSNAAIFGPTAGSGSSLGLVARPGDGAPGVADGAEFSSLFSPKLNNAGDVAFQATLQTGNDDGSGVVDIFNRGAIFGQKGDIRSTLSLLARGGASAPGVSDSAEFFSLISPTLNAAGDVAFLADLFIRDGLNQSFLPRLGRSAIFGPTGGVGLGVVARAGDEAPDVADGIEFGGFRDLALNTSGDIVFLASLQPQGNIEAGVIDFFPDFGLFAFIDGSLRLLVREGDPFEVVSPETLVPESRTIASVSFDTFRDSIVLNDAGVLALGLTFTDGSSGIFTVDITPVPEPISAVFALLTILGFVVRRVR